MPVAPPDIDVCALCHGARFVRVNVPLDHPDFGNGRAVPLRRATRRERRAATRLAALLEHRRAGAADVREPHRARPQRRTRASRSTTAAASTTRARSPMRPTAGSCSPAPAAAARRTSPPPIVNRMLERGEPALFVVVPDLLDHLRAAYQPDAEVGYDELFERVRNAPVLVLDDLGTQAPTPWAQEKLFQLINHRFNTRLPTIVTTNLLPEQIDERLRTRLTDAGIARVYVLEARRHVGAARARRARPPADPRDDVRALRRAQPAPAASTSGAARERVPPGARLRRKAGRLAAVYGPARRRQDASRRRHRQLPAGARRGVVVRRRAGSARLTCAAASRRRRRAARTRPSTR